MDVFFLANVCDELCILICGLRIGPFNGLIDDVFSMLSLIACHHVNRLVNQVEVVLLRGYAWIECEIAIDEGLIACIEEGVYVGLVPTSLLNRKKFRSDIV